MKLQLLCLILVTFISTGPFCTAAESGIRDPFLLPFGPKNGDTFNTRERTCSEKPINLGFDFKYGDETFRYAFVCKGGFIALTNDENSVEPLTTNLISAFWTEDVNANHWVNPFVDQLCSQILEYTENENGNSLWSDQSITFPNYFSMDDVVYNDMCSGEGQMSADDLEEMIRSESVRTRRWVNEVYGLPNPSALTSRDLTLTGNIFKRVDKSKHTLDILTSFLKKVTQQENFEADWLFVVTWFRMPLTRLWDGWLSQQTCLVCGGDKDRPRASLTSPECYVIWFYEAAATAPCDGCQELPLPLETGFYINGSYNAFPLSPEGRENVTKLLSGSNIGVPGAYVFHLKDGVPSEPNYSSVNLFPCTREISPKECDLYSDKNLFTLTGFFCDTPIPSGDQIEIVFEGAYTSKTVRPQRVDQLSGDIEAYFPFWGVVEPVAVYLLIDGKVKEESMVQANFVSLHERFGFPTFASFWDISLTEDIAHGWPGDFPFQSDNLFIRSVVVKGANSLEDGVDLTNSDVAFVDLETNDGVMLKADNEAAGLKYKIILSPRNFKEFPEKGDITIKVPVIKANFKSEDVDRMAMCENWIEEQEKINISHCLDRFRGPYCSGGLCVDYSCPLSAEQLVHDDVTKFDELSWHHDLLCPFGGNSNTVNLNGINPCSHANGAAFCIESMSFPCRDSNDPSKLFQISNRCCYDVNVELITNYNDGAGGIALSPGVKHDFARYFEQEWEAKVSCCFPNEVLRRENGEKTCDAYRRLRPFVQPNQSN